MGAAHLAPEVSLESVQLGLLGVQLARARVRAVQPLRRGRLRRGRGALAPGELPRQSRLPLGLLRGLRLRALRRPRSLFCRGLPFPNAPQSHIHFT